MTRLEADRIQELFEVREVLEAQMVRLATQRAAPETWDHLLEVFGDALDQAPLLENPEGIANARPLLPLAVLAILLTILSSTITITPERKHQTPGIACPERRSSCSRPQRCRRPKRRPATPTGW